MAKETKSTTVQADASDVERLASDLFVRSWSPNPPCPTDLAERCFKAAAEFVRVAEEIKTRPADKQLSAETVPAELQNAGGK